MNTQASLKRSLSLGMITFFGLGNILGAGIYVLVGKVAGEAGYYAPLAFFVASIIAALSASPMRNCLPVTRCRRVWQPISTRHFTGVT